MHPFPSPIPELQSEIENALDQATRFDEDCPSKLKDAIRYSLLAGGKRLRPILTLLAHEACGGQRAEAMPAACALEMIHTYSLIHDDLPAMDDDDLRRGRPTNHIQYGEATAILAGDGLLTHAFFWLSSQIQEPRHAVACCRELSSAAGVSGMVGGQQADLEAETLARNEFSVEILQGIHRRKTGRLIRVALRMGGILADATSEQMEQLTRYGEAIGLAFQIADDVLDRTGSREKMGKQVSKDDSHSKLTYPALMGLEESRRQAETLVQQAVSCLDIFPTETNALKAIARYSVERDR